MGFSFHFVDPLHGNDWWDPIACGRDSWDQNLRFLYGDGGRFACTERRFYRRGFGDCRAGGYYEEWILALHPVEL